MARRRRPSSMCGIAGLHLRDPELYPQLGRLLESMLGGVVERGPDSAGVAVYGDTRRCPDGDVAVSVLLPPDADTSGLVGDGALVTPAGDTTIIAAPTGVDELVARVGAAFPSAVVVGAGHELAVYKGTGHPRELAATYDLVNASG